MSSSSTACQKSYVLCQLLDSIKIDVNSKQHNHSDLITSTEKLSKIVSTQERSRREIFTKHPSSIAQLVDIIRVHQHLQDDVVTNVLSIINDMLTSGKRIATFLTNDIVPVLFQLITSSSFDQSKQAESKLILICKLLTKVGSKDKPFCVLARLTGALGAVCSLIKVTNPNDRSFELLLQVLKLLAKSDVNCNQMAVVGLTMTLFNLIKNSSISKRGMITLLEILVLLTKSKAGLADGVKKEHVEIIVSELTEYLRVESFRFNIPVRKLVLSLTKNIISHAVGAVHFQSAGGCVLLYKTGLEMMTHKEMDDILKTMILILRCCLEQPLPLNHTCYPKFEAFNIESNASSDAFTKNNNNKKSKESLDISGCTHSSDECDIAINTSSLPSDHSIQQSQLPMGITDETTIPVFHVLPFLSQSIPTVSEHHPLYQMEPLIQRKTDTHRVMLFTDFQRYLSPDDILNQCVYDVEHVSVKERISFSIPHEMSHVRSVNCDGKDTSHVLSFESRFESGNLRKAIQIRSNEYDLMINPDASCNHHCQWFYFRVQGMSSSVPYRFNLINCEKLNSQFNFGMQPVVYSMREAFNGRPGWERHGSNVCYYKNVFIKGSSEDECNGFTNSSRYHYTTTFTLTFPHSNDTCFVAYHYPFPYTSLQRQLQLHEREIPDDLYFNREVLCRTRLGNRCDLLTVTDKQNITENGEDKKDVTCVVLTARVHPGETNSSWVMKGVLDFLCGHFNGAKDLLKLFIFKIVPMLNPDGVLNGSHRCSILGDDLNRCWINPDKEMHPTIFHTKNLIKSVLNEGRKLLMFCDFHGHSRRKHFFLFGCDPNLSNAQQSNWSTNSSTTDASTSAAAARTTSTTQLINNNNDDNDDDRSTSDETSCKAETSNDLSDRWSCDKINIPHDDINRSASNESLSIENTTNLRTEFQNTLARCSPSFSIQNCSYKMEKSKSSTARIVVFKELGVNLSFTLETSYCGADQGLYKGFHFGTRELEEIGRNFCESLLCLANEQDICQ